MDGQEPLVLFFRLRRISLEHPKIFIGITTAQPAHMPGHGVSFTPWRTLRYPFQAKTEIINDFSELCIFHCSYLLFNKFKAGMQAGSDFPPVNLKTWSGSSNGKSLQERIPKGFQTGILAIAEKIGMNLIGGQGIIDLNSQ